MLEGASARQVRLQRGRRVRQVAHLRRKARRQSMQLSTRMKGTRCMQGKVRAVAVAHRRAQICIGSMRGAHRRVGEQQVAMLCGGLSVESLWRTMRRGLVRPWQHLEALHRMQGRRQRE